MNLRNIQVDLQGPWQAILQTTHDPWEHPGHIESIGTLDLLYLESIGELWPMALPVVVTGQSAGRRSEFAKNDAG